MSKYIRIDNGVYKVGIDKEAKESGVSNYYYIEVDKGVRLTFDEEELNKGRLGNTIEELCDEYICRDECDKEYRPFRFHFLKDLYNFIKENELFKRYKVYGAIWTDKGLIYVAKMNKKGKLELI